MFHLVTRVIIGQEASPHRFHNHLLMIVMTDTIVLQK